MKWPGSNPLPAGPAVELEIVVCHLCQAPIDTTVNHYAAMDHLLDCHRWWFRLPDEEPTRT